MPHTNTETNTVTNTVTNTETHTVTNTETKTVTNTDTNREKTRAQMGRYQYRGTLDCTLVSYITAELEKALKTLSQHEAQERENTDKEERIFIQHCINSIKSIRSFRSIRVN